MGLLDIFRPRHREELDRVALAPSFSTITDYAPVFSTWRGGAYEKALVRSSVEKSALLASKLKPEVLGNAKPRVRRAIDTAPNQYMSWPKMIGRLMTIYLNDTTAAVVPSLDEGLNITGLFPLKFDTAEVVEYAGEPWIKFYLAGGDTMAIELKYVCLLTRFQYESDFFGGGNGALESTLQLIDYQEQAQEQAIRNSARIQFIAKSNSMMHDADIERKRDKFSEANLSASNRSGLLIYDQTFSEMKQVEPMNYTISGDEMERIESNVFNYFGINKSILQSDYTEEQFGAFYESQIEPFAVQLGEGLTQMLYTPTERRHGNRVMFSASRLEYASNASKRNMIRDMTDRSIMTVNEAREVLQLPPVEGGDVFLARGEYKNQLGASGPGNQQSPVADEDFDLGGDDDIYNDTDGRGAKEVDE